MHTVLDYLEQSARRLPEKTAFADPDRSVTFGQLLYDARIIAAATARLVPPTEPVPVYMDKSVEAVQAFMGVAMAGCCYAMMDRRQPSKRQEQILNTLSSSVLLTVRACEEEVRQLPFTGTVLYLEDLLSGNSYVIDHLSEEIRSGKICPDENLSEEDCLLLQKRRRQMLDTDPLYINFTSGSTGTPKGVVVGHRSVMDFIDTFSDLFDIQETDVIGNQAPFDFDVSVKDLYTTLRQGATMQIIPTKYFSIPKQLLDFLEERQVTTLIWAVSALCLVSQLHGFTYKIPSKIRQVIFSGEVMPVRQLNIWREAMPQARFINVYGPTEITCNCTYYIVDRAFSPGDTLPMGKAFPNERVFLLDESNRQVLPEMTGREGEICVAGSALALGYYNDPVLTEKVFVQNPLHKRYRDPVYKTGDLAFYNEKKELIFIGRRDLQIKHMGHRIELGEIEKAMDSIPEAERVCVLFAKQRITACYTGNIEKKELVQKLNRLLPAFMVPSRFIQMEELPLTKNGKIDRQRLLQQLSS